MGRMDIEFNLLPWGRQGKTVNVGRLFSREKKKIKRRKRRIRGSRGKAGVLLHREKERDVDKERRRRVWDVSYTEKKERAFHRGGRGKKCLRG